MHAVLVKRARRERRTDRVRKFMRGTKSTPRLTVFRSLQHIYAQLIDDVTGQTLCAVSTRAADVRGQLKYGGNKAAAAAVGKAIGEKAKALGVQKVSFDRGGCKYHGRVKALADAAREAGLKF